MAEAGSCGAGNLSDYFRSGVLVSELLYKFRAGEVAVQTQFNRFLLRQPGGDSV